MCGRGTSRHSKPPCPDQARLEQSQHSITLRMDMFGLPDDVFRTHIISFVDNKDIATLDAALANRDLREKFLTKMQFRIISCLGNVEVDADVANWLVKRKTYLEHAKFAADVSNETLTEMRDVLKHTQTLDLTGCINISDFALGTIAASCSNVRYLYLNGCSGVNNSQGLKSLFSSATKLEFVDLNNLRSLNKAGEEALLLKLAESSADTLTSYNSSDTYGINDAGITHVAEHCTKLVNMDVSYCPKLTNKSILKVAEHCRLLQSLNLEGCRKVTSKCVSEIAFNCPGMLDLNVSYIDRIRDECIIDVANHCPLLRFLAVCGCIQLTDDSMIEIARKCPSMESLFLTQTRLSDFSLYEVSEHCPNLKLLDISQCDNFLEEAVMAVIERCVQLDTVHAEDTRNLTDATLVAMSQCLPELVELSLDYFKDGTEEGLLTLVTRCPKLHSFFVSGCTYVTDAVVVALAHTCPDLEYVDFTGCVLLTEAVLPVLAQNCPKLISVTVTNCPLISSEAVDAAIELTDASIYR